MAIDKAVDSAVLDSTLTAIADAIREKAGTTDPIAFDAMAAAIAAIESGAKVETGTKTFGSLVTGTFTVNHSLNDIPDFFIVFNDNFFNSHVSTSDYEMAVAVYLKHPLSVFVCNFICRQYSVSRYMFEAATTVSSDSVVVDLKNSAEIQSGTMLYWIGGCF